MLTWANYSGLRRFLIVNGHVGNSSALRVAIDGLRFERADMRVGLVSWCPVDPDVAAETTSDVEDWHGNRAETSLMLALAPDLVDLQAAKRADDEDRSPGLVFAYTAKQPSRNGITGRPSGATTELGIRLWTKIVESTAKLVQLAATEEPPFGHDRTGAAPQLVSLPTTAGEPRSESEVVRRVTADREHPRP